MRHHFLYLTALAAVFAFASCTKDAVVDDNSIDNAEHNPDAVHNDLTTITFSSFSGDDNRVSYPAATHAEETPAALQLIAEIANPSKEDNYFTKFEGRYLSATSVYYDATKDTYYATYHMQGNNYATTLDTESAGAIQSFTVKDNEVKIGTGFRAPKPAEEDFDFNHLYFDNTAQRIVISGHNVKGGNQKNTNAVIGVFDPNAGTYTYTTVKTDEKDYDADGKSLGYTDAGDVNSVTRFNDVPSTFPDHKGQAFGYNVYLVATRKGMAVLSAHEKTLFQPALTADGTNYFVKTPGSAKYVSNSGTGSYCALLYLTEDYKAQTGEEITATTSSHAKIAHISYCTGSGEKEGDMSNWGFFQTWSSPFNRLDPQNLAEFPEQKDLPEVITPVDGKNTLVVLGSSDYYVALGTNGMYYRNNIQPGGEYRDGVMKFGNRPVNCISVDVTPYQSGNKGYLYVANGSKLSILDNGSLEEVASWNMPSKDEEGNEIASSANYIAVTKAANGERTIAVAYGQAGIKVFKFNPDNLKK